MLSWSELEKSFIISIPEAVEMAWLLSLKQHRGCDMSANLGCGYIVVSSHRLWLHSRI